VETAAVECFICGNKKGCNECEYLTDYEQRLARNLFIITRRDIFHTTDIFM
jgi:hypothetical protein